MIALPPVPPKLEVLQGIKPTQKSEAASSVSARQAKPTYWQSKVTLRYSSDRGQSLDGSSSSLILAVLASFACLANDARVSSGERLYFICSQDPGNASPMGVRFALLDNNVDIVNAVGFFVVEVIDEEDADLFKRQVSHSSSSVRV